MKEEENGEQAKQAGAGPQIPSPSNLTDVSRFHPLLSISSAIRSPKIHSLPLGGTFGILALIPTGLKSIDQPAVIGWFRRIDYQRHYIRSASPVSSNPLGDLGMEKSSLAEQLEAEFEMMPRQIQTAARFVLEHPTDVALMSMRAQGRRAGVSHSTMVRLATWLGLDSYDELRAIYARSLHARDRHEHQADGPRLQTVIGSSTFGTVTDTLVSQVASLSQTVGTEELLEVADLLAGSRRIFCLGFGSAHTVARQFAFLMSQLGKHTITLDTANGNKAIDRAGSGDAMLMIGFSPYAPGTDEFVQKLSRQGFAIAAITNNKTSPLARFARKNIVVSTRSHSFFPSIVPALSVVEFLAALTADKTGVRNNQLRKRADEHLAIADIYLQLSQISNSRGITPT